ncbi:transketolase [Acidipropionibacterium virtanenii]|uniref:Transketolase 1 n=1 Tax=Acidipropionibacterium virtanenii TaxID=2057246 RepID=A0A344UXP5_9ACTN|nr:transketolase [Acidipropionibacterium virtanenii]AXE40043.1 Transketolase 1 [Acidipropionibacterium virtanenii]
MTTSATNTDQINTEQLRELAAQLRVDSIRSSTSAGSGHPTSSLSAADLLAVLMSRHLRYDWDEPENPANDHLIFSKGHASPLIYSVFKAAGQITEEELVEGYRRFGSRLQGHPTPVLPWVDVATGSLGQGLPDGVGVALAGKYLDKLPYRVWVVCGDSELAEGSIWEAVDKASYYDLDNLVAIVDVNRLGQRGATELGWDVDAYARRFEAFGARVITIDGHDLDAIDAALTDAENPDGRPTVILARTVKGKGVPQVEDSPDWHGKPLPSDIADAAIESLGGVRNDVVTGPRPGVTTPSPAPLATTVELPSYEPGQEMATRKAYGAALTAVGRADPKVVALDAEVSNSTGTGDFVKAIPERYFEMFISEAQLIGSATGLSVRGYKPFVSTFAAFLTRAFDFIRMGAISQADLRIAGSHAGVEIGADGPSQMALEDLAMMRAVEGSTVLYPSDATSTVALVARMAATDGISYLRTTRGGYPVLYDSDETFQIGGSKVLRSGEQDQVTLVGAGVTVHQAIAAADRLAEQGIGATVIDAYSVKPIDAGTLERAVRRTNGRLVIAEDHHPQGGLGEAVLSGLATFGIRDLDVAHLAVRGIPGSGTSAELLGWAGIDADGIAKAAKRLIG